MRYLSMEVEVLTIVAIGAHLATCIPIDNAVVLDPLIACLSDRITVAVDARNPWFGRLYARGYRYDRNAPECSTRGDGTLSTGLIELTFNQCGVKRSRSLNPKGVFVTAELIMSFHPVFVTKVDQAYKIQCFYMEADKTVSEELEVSMITTGLRTAVVPMPQCEYSIRDGPDRAVAQPVRFAVIGQQLWHHWHCETDTDDVFCMTVFDCKVEDTPGSRRPVQLIDNFGCALDKYALGNLDYPGDLSAVKEAHAFRFNEKPNVYFDCQIMITVKDPNGDCPRPLCNPLAAAVRSKRSLPQTTNSDFGTIDASLSGPIFVADVDMGVGDSLDQAKVTSSFDDEKLQSSKMQLHIYCLRSALAIAIINNITSRVYTACKWTPR